MAARGGAADPVPGRVAGVRGILRRAHPRDRPVGHWRCRRPGPTPAGRRCAATAGSAPGPRGRARSVRRIPRRGSTAGPSDHPEPVSELAHALWRVGVECGQQSAASEGQAAGAALPAALDATTSPEQLAYSEERLGQGLRTGADWSVGPQRRELGATPTVTVPVRPTASAMSAVLIVLIVLVVRPGRLPRGRRCVLRHYILQVVESCSLYALS